jgi:hypothetical protein
MIIIGPTCSGRIITEAGYEHIVREALAAAQDSLNKKARLVVPSWHDREHIAKATGRLFDREIPVYTGEPEYTVELVVVPGGEWEVTSC